MTRYIEPDPGFDPRIADWLEADPVDAPGQVLETVLAAYPIDPSAASYSPAAEVPDHESIRVPRRRGDGRDRRNRSRGRWTPQRTTTVRGPSSRSPARPSRRPRRDGARTVSNPEPTARPTVSATWTATGNMVEIRFGESATLLPNGQVLVAGGNPQFNRRGLTRATAELYDPSTGRWTLTGSMHEAREGHAAVLLANGQVLVLGGGVSERRCGSPGVQRRAI